ncbi:uncharacterized protein K444DRAFT_593457 [Hyaloscypha bicolor E]|uniref:Uncharacterized protein n=1 Tax=Hyaloscypha bicolor E TaxID=1095630 RepID=A0A2J6T1F9_9HELO|nr:uncharacterized protein K444DRAFT_593457 [Hyaloscypha bicolor E]KAH8782519.1 hypothetical protein BGZ57DRAFT_758825 [Hyaloscypha finlandica]KAH8795831.1 hypothetical protein F5882DRAFT_321086 [Hyaloscypha sp. PMI_1271]PMD56856.1 hypothetical protein K444DRAFT_593457 [Hyaloscypha bicolor E]
MASVEKISYWIPNWDINKKVITQEIQYYLGPEATVRPYTRDGEDGFLITTPGQCLTDEQINDICLKSREVWEKQAAARSKKESDKQLKRPLHKPIVVSRGSKSTDSSSRHHRRHSDERDRGEGSSRRRSDERRYDPRDRW